MKESFVIAIPSKGRLNGPTFRLVEETSVPVYVYVHSSEYDSYVDALPDHFNVVSHNLNGIGAIRRFIQEEHFKADETVLMMDDDIYSMFGLYGEVGIDTAIDFIRNYPGCSVVGFLYTSDLQASNAMVMASDIIFCGCLCICLALRPSAYLQGVIYSDDDAISEDYDFSLQTIIKSRLSPSFKVTYAPFTVLHDFGGESSNFSQLWYHTRLLKLYEKYGNLVSLYLRDSGILKGSAFLNINFDLLHVYLTRGVVYSPLTNYLLRSWAESDLPVLKKASHFTKELLSEIESKPLTNRFLNNKKDLDIFKNSTDLRRAYPKISLFLDRGQINIENDLLSFSNPIFPVLGSGEFSY